MAIFNIFGEIWSLNIKQVMNFSIHISKFITFLSCRNKRTLIIINTTQLHVLNVTQCLLYLSVSLNIAQRKIQTCSTKETPKNYSSLKKIRTLYRRSMTLRYGETCPIIILKKHIFKSYATACQTVHFHELLSFQNQNIEFFLCCCNFTRYYVQRTCS